MRYNLKRHIFVTSLYVRYVYIVTVCKSIVLYLSGMEELICCLQICVRKMFIMFRLNSIMAFLSG
jgi:hypothetical protein